MKKITLILCLTLFLADCKTKQKTKNKGETKSETAGKGSKAGPKSELEIAQARWPGTSASDLSEGKTIYETKCTRCHAAKEIVTRSEENWKAAIDKMAPKAKLTAEEKEKLTRYILSYREANTSTD